MKRCHLGKLYGFKEQLGLGDESEVLFVQTFALQYPGIKKATTRKYDFDSDSGKLELKTDRYDVNRTENVFIERWSVLEQAKPGGPYQALTNGADHFIYWFHGQDWCLDCDDLKALIAILDSMHYPMIQVKNKGYVGGGYKVPLELYRRLACVHTIHKAEVKK